MGTSLHHRCSLPPNVAAGKEQLMEDEMPCMTNGVSGAAVRPFPLNEVGQSSMVVLLGMFCLDQ